MDREKIHKLLDVVLDISEMRIGADGFPFVHFAASNYPVSLEIYMENTGFKKGAPLDGHYLFNLTGGISQIEYSVCLEHLEKLKKKAEDLIKEKDVNGKDQ